MKTLTLFLVTSNTKKVHQVTGFSSVPKSSPWTPVVTRWSATKWSGLLGIGMFALLFLSFWPLSLKLLWLVVDFLFTSQLISFGELQVLLASICWDVGACVVWPRLFTNTITTRCEEPKRVAPLQTTKTNVSSLVVSLRAAIDEVIGAQSQKGRRIRVELLTMLTSACVPAVTALARIRRSRWFACVLRSRDTIDLYYYRLVFLAVPQGLCGQRVQANSQLRHRQL